MKRYNVEVVRDDIPEMVPANEGEWLRYEDHIVEVAALRATIKRFVTVAFEVPLAQYDDIPVGTFGDYLNGPSKWTDRRERIGMPLTPLEGEPK